MINKDIRRFDREPESLIHVKAMTGSGARRGGFWAVSKDDIATFVDIEESQAALRRSIESARELSLESERLIRQFRGESDPEGAD